MTTWMIVSEIQINSYTVARLREGVDPPAVGASVTSEHDNYLDHDGLKYIVVRALTEESSAFLERIYQIMIGLGYGSGDGCDPGELLHEEIFSSFNKFLEETLTK
jgi:hypothetical protein